MGNKVARQITSVFCYWNSRDKANSKTRKKWPGRNLLNVGEKKLVAETFVPGDKIVFCILHMKSGLKSNLLKD